MYIPGFTNYLEASIPEYGAEPIMDAPQRALVEPMTQEAVAPAEVPFDINSLAGLDLSGLNSLYGMNFGSNFGGGGAGGGIYQADPNLQYIGAPKSNKGNPTSRTGGNTFAVRADQPVRLVDHRTNQIVFEGSGFDAARKATELGQNMSNTLGRKANYSIQTADPSGNYSTVAYEKKNKSTLGQIANVVGTVAPLALGFVPGFGQLSLLAKMGAAAGAGGLGAALKGDDILKGALLSGATAGLVSGTGLDKAIGGALSNATKGVAQGAAQGAAQGLSDDIVVTALSRLAQGTGGALGQAALSEAGNAASRALSGYKTPAEQFAQQPLPEAFQPPIDDTINVIASRAASAAPNYGGALANTLGPIATEFLPKGALPEPLPSEPTPVTEPTPVAEPAPVDDSIVVSGNRFVSGSGSPFAAAVPIPVNAMLSGALSGAEPAPAEKTAEEIEAEKNPIVVTAPTNLLPADFVTSAAAAAAANAANGMGNAPDRAEMTDEELDTYMNSDAAAKGLSLSDIADYLRLGSTGVGLIGGLIEGGKGGSSGVMYPGGGTGTLNPLFSAKLPAPNMPGATGNFAARPQSDFAVVNGQPRDWTRYGFGPEASFFNYASQPGSAPISAPITTPIPNEPSAPAMYAPDVDNMRFARGGSPKRNAFAVSGPGTGRSDDIPAVLSDGEYVMDAETVALLGDGSSKAGAEALDRLRVNLRKHKGQKLAKGKFSVNAKRPERYLVGGRI
jgi:hypothetical protein